LEAIFVPLEGKFLRLLIAFVIVMITLNEKLVVKLSNTSIKINSAFATGGNNFVEVLESLTASF
jgi:hypothetical protein